MLVPLPPVARTFPLIRRLKTPGSSAGTTTFLSSTVAVQRGESADAVAFFPVSVQTSVLLPASKGVWNTPMRRPFSKVVGWPRSWEDPPLNPFSAPIGTVTTKSLGFW